MAKTIMLAGHSRLPKGMAVRDIYETLTMTVEIDVKYGVIMNASCTLATEHAQLFIGDLLKGYSLRDGLESFIEIIEQGYHGKAQDALIAACKDVYNQYLLLRKE